MPREDYTHKLVNGKKVPLTETEIDEHVAREEAWNAGAADRAWKSLRDERDRKIATTDWRASNDLTLSAEWSAYRQALRDLPANYDDTTVQGEITWPIEPS